MTMITQKEFEDEMKQICEKPYPNRYSEASVLMCKVLLQFGYDVGVKTFMSKMTGMNFNGFDGKGEST